MEISSWDPLASNTEADTEIISAAQKRQIKNILKSYVGMYDSFSELIQNALDAVDRRANDNSEVLYTPRLWITIDLLENSFTITDNGVGFNQKEFRSFLAPNISFKDGTKSRGNKGVGATYLGYGFNNLKFATKSVGHSFTGELSGGREWVEDSQGIITRPTVKHCDSFDKAFDCLERGSSFKVVFGGENIRPRDLSWYQATKPDQWLYLLLIKTPLGSINYINEKSSTVLFDLTVIDKDGNISTREDEEAKYLFPHTQIGASVELKEILKAQQRLANQGKDASIIAQKYRRLNGIYEHLDTSELLTLRPLENEYQEIVTRYKIEAYGYFTFSTSVWDQFNDQKAKLRKGYRVLRGGLQLANNYMIQGELTAIPLTSNIGYQNQTHIVVHFRDADPDLGRKGFQPELKGVAEQVSISIVNRFKKWRSLLKADTGVKPDIAKEIELHQWIRDQENHERIKPLSLSNKNFFAPINEISITSEPLSEQDVIVLFNQLIAGGVIRGINLLATNQRTQYDGIFRFVVREPLANHEFDEEKNPLGVQELHHQSDVVSPPKILEYKYNLDSLINEFANEEKNEKEIHLVVTWDVGNEWKKSYEVTSLLDLENLHLRPFHGVTHIFHSGTTQFSVIALRELINYLNGVREVQNWQGQTYGDNLF